MTQLQQITTTLVVEDEVQMSIIELCHTINAQTEHIIAWVNEGILSPEGESPEQWCFSGNALQRAKKAMWLAQDLEINTPGVALALDLLDEIANLQKKR